MISVLPLDVAGYRQHALHGADQTWAETNCYVDLWIEVLHSLGLDPVPAAAVVFRSAFEGDQWTFLKFEPADLHDLYGVRVSELNVWRPLETHVLEQLGRGRLLTVEVDAHFLPDVPVSYRTEHVKTTIVPNAIDRAARVLRYFHNAGYFELSGDDYDGALRGPGLPPYVELVTLPAEPRTPSIDAVRAVLARHLADRAVDDPVAEFGARLSADLSWLRDEPDESFHLWAFATCRQLGSSAALGAALAGWLHERDGGGLGEAVAELSAAADQAKTLQFAVARAARRGKDAPLDLVTGIGDHWRRGVDLLAERYG